MGTTCLPDRGLLSVSDLLFASVLLYSSVYSIVSYYSSVSDGGCGYCVRVRMVWFILFYLFI